MTRKMISRAFSIAIIVGSLLNLINSYDVIIGGNYTQKNVVRILLTYVTPFCVSLFSSVQATKLNGKIS